mgnify:CR=1 FL=1
MADKGENYRMKNIGKDIVMFYSQLSKQRKIGLAVLLVAFLINLFLSSIYPANGGNRYIASDDFQDIKRYDFLYVASASPEQGMLGLCRLDIFRYPRPCRIDRIYKTSDETYLNITIPGGEKTSIRDRAFLGEIKMRISGSSYIPLSYVSLLMNIAAVIGGVIFLFA